MLEGLVDEPSGVSSAEGGDILRVWGWVRMRVCFCSEGVVLEL